MDAIGSTGLTREAAEAAADHLLLAWGGLCGPLGRACTAAAPDTVASLWLPAPAPTARADAWNDSGWEVVGSPEPEPVSGTFLTDPRLPRGDREQGGREEASFAMPLRASFAGLVALCLQAASPAGRCQPAAVAVCRAAVALAAAQREGYGEAETAAAHGLRGALALAEDLLSKEQAAAVALTAAAFCVAACPRPPSAVLDMCHSTMTSTWHRMPPLTWWARLWSALCGRPVPRGGGGPMAGGGSPKEADDVADHVLASAASGEPREAALAALRVATAEQVKRAKCRGWQLPPWQSGFVPWEVPVLVLAASDPVFASAAEVLLGKAGSRRQVWDAVLEAVVADNARFLHLASEAGFDALAMEAEEGDESVRFSASLETATDPTLCTPSISCAHFLLDAEPPLGGEDLAAIARTGDAELLREALFLFACQRGEGAVKTADGKHGLLLAAMRVHPRFGPCWPAPAEPAAAAACVAALVRAGADPREAPAPQRRGYDRTFACWANGKPMTAWEVTQELARCGDGRAQECGRACAEAMRGV